MKRRSILASPLILALPAIVRAEPAAFRVGPGERYATFADAMDAAYAARGGTIELHAGTYLNDWSWPVWNRIMVPMVIRGLGGMARFTMQQIHPDWETDPKRRIHIPTGKGFLVVNANLTLENVALVDIRDWFDLNYGNVAGIRWQAGDLTLRNCLIEGCQMGILGQSEGGSLLIEDSEIVRNGNSLAINKDGRDHNLYVGPCKSVMIRRSQIRGVTGAGHEVKIRAAETVLIEECVIANDAGAASYCIDLPNGGDATVTGCYLHKGAQPSNAFVIHYGGEKQLPFPPGSALAIKDTVIVSDYPKATGILNHPGKDGASAAVGMVRGGFYGIPRARWGLGERISFAPDVAAFRTRPEIATVIAGRPRL